MVSALVSGSRLATSRPHKFQGRIFPKRPFIRSRSGRASDEVARGRLVSLEEH